MRGGGEQYRWQPAFHNRRLLKRSIERLGQAYTERSEE